MSALAETLEIGRAHSRAGRHQEACIVFSQLLQAYPGHPDVCTHLASCLDQLGHTKQAIEHYQYTLALDSNQPVVWNNLADCLRRQGQLVEAQTHFEQALKLQPQFDQALNNLGLVLYEQEQYHAAIQQFQILIKYHPTFTLGWFNMGIVRNAQGQPDAAQHCYERALEQNPDYYDAWVNLATIHQQQGRYTRAEEAYQKAIALQPQTALAFAQYAGLQNLCGQTQKAIATYQQVLQLDPQDALSHFNLGVLLLLTGQYEEAWPHYQWRKQCNFTSTHYAHPLHGSAWQGEPLTGKRLFLYCEQGLGDTLQCLRYLPLLKAKGATLILEVKAALVPLLQSWPVVDSLLTYQADQAPESVYDLHASMMDLPGLFHTTLDTIPAGTIDLQTPSPQTQLPARPDGKQRIGLVWAGSPQHPDDAQRSCDLHHFFPLTQLEHVTLYSLQKDAAAEQLAQFAGDISDLGSTFQTFRDTASTIQQLDLIITVDTAVAHLAGLLNKPVWILLAQHNDWRWLQNRSDSPWYTSARLFRATSNHDWPRVITEVADALQAYPTAPSTEAAACPNAQERRQQAVQLHQSGQWDQAQARYQQILEHNPHDPQILHALALLYYQQQQPDRALDFAMGAVSVAPQVAQYHNTYGVILESLGQYQAAVNAQKQAITLQENYTEAWINMAISLQLLGLLDESVAVARQALMTAPNNAKAYYTLGYSLQTLGHYHEAVAALKNATRLDPDLIDAYNQLGVALTQLEQYDEAITVLQEAVTRHPTFADAFNNLAIAQRQDFQFEEAIANYERALQRDENSPVTHYNLANTLQGLGRLKQALVHYDLALRLDPNYADAHWNRALCYLLNGNYEEGWAAYHWRRQAIPARDLYPHIYDKPQWDGRSFTGQRLLIHSEQGLGDTLQLVRYLPQIKACGGTVIMETWPPLIELLALLPDIDELRPTTTDPFPATDYDLRTSIMDLPYLFETTLDTIPAKIPYLLTDTARQSLWKNRLTGSALRIGIVWAGGPTHGNDKNRSCHLRHFLPLLNRPGFRFVGLQKGPAADQMAGLPPHLQFENLGPEFNSLLDTAAALEHVDLVISVDTAVAHLAGALGKAVWTLLPFAPDWRWMLGRMDSIWYPSMILVRQTRPGDWESVFYKVGNLLRRLAGTQTQCHSPVTSEKVSI